MSGVVVVVTGASSGVGRATAVQCAERGACVVLAARNAAALGAVGCECRRRGGEGYVVPTDVSDEGAVGDLAAAAVARFGRIDVWINAAGMGIPVRVDQGPVRDLRRLLGVNVLGAVHGTRAAVPIMRRQGRGVVIDIASVVGTVIEEPHMGGYAMSTAALVTFDEVLRQELASVGEDRIAVCTILPGNSHMASSRHAGSQSGRARRSKAPAGSCERVARTVVRTASRPRSLVLVGSYGLPFGTGCATVPALLGRAAAGRGERRRPGESGSLRTLGRRAGRAAALLVVRAAVRHRARSRH
ncbi:SDR family NAD(P)-dependent oxidoreductase [Streptomyces erythrochromogenes]|uniref:SDR family NAD(P)-dependent oxidoreductase n=1 Tax=Streptomyces erythrochromogenes TaxID=285574 RepID=UPI0036B8BF02